jgi:UDP-glucose 4-epimerase
MLHRASAPGRRLALTGACSFLGRSLISLLERDAAYGRIVALDIESPRTAGRQDAHVPGRSHAADVRSAKVGEILRAEEVDAVVHLAFL